MSQKTDAVVISTIGIDTGKNTLHLIGLDDQGTIVLREKLSRSRIGWRMWPRCLIGIEAGMGTHYVARELIALGHDVRQVLPPNPQERLQGRIRDCGSCTATINTLRSGKDR
jgi:transposase